MSPGKQSLKVNTKNVKQALTTNPDLTIVADKNPFYGTFGSLTGGPTPATIPLLFLTRS